MTQALENIWHDFAGRLRAFIRRRVANNEEAEDVLQDVFLKVARHAHELPSSDKLPGWMFLIARNAIIDRYRTRKMTESVSESLPAESEAAHEEIDGLCAAFRRMIRTLPEPYREAIVQAELEGLPQVELAKRLEISVSGAKSRVQRGRQMLKRMLIECCQFEFDRRGGLSGCAPRKKSNCEECD